MEKRKGSYKGLDYYYYGSSLEEKRRNIIFYFGSRIDLRYYPSVIKSAVEAVSHGYAIITNGRYRARRALSIPVLSYSGRLFVVLSPSLDSFSYTRQEKLVLLTGGGFISFSDDEEDGMDLFDHLGIESGIDDLFTVLSLLDHAEQNRIHHLIGRQNIADRYILLLAGMA